MLTIDFVGAKVLLPQGLQDTPLSITDGLISADRAGREIDLSGFRILPGIVDLHGDGFERHVAPRRGAMKDMTAGLRATESELAANGITTGVLAQFVSWEGGLRGIEFADQVFTGLKAVRGSVVTDLLAQLRFEIHLLDLYPSLPDRIRDWGVTYTVFNDHLPHDRLSQGKKPPRLTGQALKIGRNPETHFQIMLNMEAQRGAVPPALDALCPKLVAAGVRIGSHDDQTAGQRADWHRRGARIAEFPETLEAAEAAHKAGDYVILGAPNVVRGGSHKGNVSAIDLIAMGYCNAIASDYHYPSPRRAALMLAQTGLRDLAGAWGLVSSGPAEVLGLTDRGSLMPGKRADIVVLDEQDRVAMTLSGGCVSYMSGNIAERFVRAV